MTEANTTESPSRKDLSAQHANNIFAAIKAAEADNFKLIVRAGWMLDLVDRIDESKDAISAVESV